VVKQAQASIYYSVIFTKVVFGVGVSVEGGQFTFPLLWENPRVQAAVESHAFGFARAGSNVEKHDVRMGAMLKLNLPY
jgi:hypothetical protein